MNLDPSLGTDPLRTAPMRAGPAALELHHGALGFDGLALSAVLDEPYTSRWPDNVYRHRWRPGDVVMWDNRCAMHYAHYDYDPDEPRRMHRTTAGGERPVPAFDGCGRSPAADG